MCFVSKRWHPQIPSEEHFSTAGAMSPIDALPRAQPLPLQLTDNDPRRMGKPTSALALSRRNRLSVALCSRAPPGVRLTQGLYSSHPPTWLLPFPFQPQVFSFSWEPCLNKTLMQKSSSQICSWGAYPKTLVLHKQAIRKHEATLLLLYHDETI